MFPGLIARPLRALLVLALIVAVGAGFWLWNRAGSSSPADPDEAVAAFRASGADGPVTTSGGPRPGVYTFRQTGSERGGVGPLRLSRPLPAAAVYVVTPAPGGYREELSLSAEHVEGATLRVGPKGIRELARRTDVTFLGVGRDDRRDLVPPPLRLPRRPVPGAAWRSEYLAGALPVVVGGRVLRADRAEVEGRAHPVVVIRTVTRTGGAHPGRRVDTIWWSVRRALPLRWSIDLEIEGVVTLRTRADLALESLTPRV